jgi:hypothetical protein
MAHVLPLQESRPSHWAPRIRPASGQGTKPRQLYSPFAASQVSRTSPYLALAAPSCRAWVAHTRLQPEQNHCCMVILPRENYCIGFCASLLMAEVRPDQSVNELSGVARAIGFRTHHERSERLPVTSRSTSASAIICAAPPPDRVFRHTASRRHADIGNWGSNNSVDANGICTETEPGGTPAATVISSPFTPRSRSPHSTTTSSSS